MHSMHSAQDVYGSPVQQARVGGEGKGFFGALGELRDRYLPNLDARAALTLGALGVAAYYFFTYDPLEGYLDEEESKPTDDELDEVWGGVGRKQMPRERAPMRSDEDNVGSYNGPRRSFDFRADLLEKAEEESEELEEDDAEDGEEADDSEA